MRASNTAVVVVSIKLPLLYSSSPAQLLLWSVVEVVLEAVKIGHSGQKGELRGSKYQKKAMRKKISNLNLGKTSEFILYADRYILFGIINKIQFFHLDSLG